MSLRQAINDKCRQCAHDREAPGTWREQVAQCSVLAWAMERISSEDAAVSSREATWWEHP